MDQTNASETAVSAETKEKQERSQEQRDRAPGLHPLESAQMVIETIEKDLSDFKDGAEKTQSISWVDVALDDQGSIASLKDAAAESMHEFDRRAKQLEEDTMKKLEAEVSQELASTEERESTEDRLFDRDLFIKEYTRYKKTIEEGGRNIGLYRFKDKFVKLVQARRSMSREKLARIKERTNDLGHVFIPEDIIDIDPKTCALVMPLAEGVTGNKLTRDEIQSIPDNHWQAFEATVRTLSDRGITTDLTKRSNFLYDKQNGFQFIDLDRISEDGAATEKFFKKDGKTYYFPFEQFRFFPKEYKGAKAMFEDISTYEKE